jgi:hypothetical protein
MRKVLILLFCHLALLKLNAQSWKTIFKSDTYLYTPWQQFSINPYTNDIWLMGSYEVSVIEDDGTVQIFENDELGTIDIGLYAKFAFTPQHTYLARAYGLSLYSLDNYTPQLEYVFNDYSGELTTNGDTVFIVRVDMGGYHRLIKYTDNSTTVVSHGAPRMIAKNSFLYADIGTKSYLIYYPEEANSTYVVIQTDPQYLGGTFNDWKFSRLTDTLYVGGKEGISLAYNFDFFDTITPNNTSGMLSPNVLEMEFDHEDKLWAIFGDSNDDPIGIAKLEGSNWIDYTPNCPVDFSYFLGMEIDTLGNVWLADNDALHSLLGPNSPSWLSLEENSWSFKVYPNPSKDYLNIDTEHFAFATVHDLNGREIAHFSESSIHISNLQSGVYLLKVYTTDGRVGIQKVVKE